MKIYDQIREKDWFGGMRLICIDRQLGFLQFGRTCGTLIVSAALFTQGSVEA